MVKIYIPKKIHNVIKGVHDTHKSMEWSALCKTIDWKDGYAIVDIKFPKQENQSAHTEIIEEGLDEFGQWVVENDLDNMKNWNVWLHSHHTMGLFWSADDERQKAAHGFGGKKHFFHIVTGIGEDRKNSSYDGVKYKGCVTFYEFDTEVEAEFEFGLVGEDEYKDKKEEIIFAAEQKKQEQLEEITKQTDRLLEEKIQEATTLMEEKFSGFNEYMSKICKKTMSIDSDKMLKDEIAKIKKEVEVIKKGIEKDVNDKIDNETDEKISELLTPYVQLEESLEDEHVNVFFEDKIVELQENERFPSYNYGKHKYKKKYEWEDDYDDRNFYDEWEWDKTTATWKRKEEDKKIYEPTPRGWLRSPTLGEWCEPKYRVAEEREKNYFDNNNGKFFYTTGVGGSWKSYTYYLY